MPNNSQSQGGLPIPKELYEALLNGKPAVRFVRKWRITRTEITRVDCYEDSSIPGFITEIEYDQGENNHAEA